MEAEDLEGAWYYDNRVTPEKVIVRAEERAVLRTGRAGRPRREAKRPISDGVERGEDEEEGGGSASSAGSPQGSGSSRSSLSFWNEGAYLSEASEPAPPPRPYYEVDEAAVQMMSAAMESYRRRIQLAVEEKERADREASSSAKERWAFVLEAEKAESSTKELLTRSLSYQRDFSSARSNYINLETALQILHKENNATEAVQGKEARELSREIATAREGKAEREATLRRLQEECEREIASKKELEGSRDASVEKEVELYNDVVQDLERNLRTAKTQLRCLEEDTGRLEEEAQITEEMLLTANADLKMLRNAQRIEESVLQAELAVSNMEDKDINKRLHEVIMEVNKEICSKAVLQQEITDLNRRIRATAKLADALKQEEKSSSRLVEKAKAQLGDLQPAPQDDAPQGKGRAAEEEEEEEPVVSVNRKKKKKKKKKKSGEKSAGGRVAKIG
ncbi:hypothetical protein HOP50_09g55710 [Chloropicon primus]|nr:hypothetical protein HOP50_09g55710 [Chloropicon primus]